MKRICLSLDMTLILVIAFVKLNVDLAIGFSLQAAGSKAEIGGNATFQILAHFLHNEKGVKYKIQRKGVDIVEVNMQKRKMERDPKSFDSRYSFSIKERKLTITGLRCSDDMELACQFIAFQSSRNVTVKKYAFAHIYVKVPPKSPKSIITSPDDLSMGIPGGSTLNATCIANTGRPRKGEILWRIYYEGSGAVQDIQDSRVSRKLRRLGFDEENCTERWESTLSFLPRHGKSIELACFVRNEDYQPAIPDKCTVIDHNDPNEDYSDFCSKTSPIDIIHSKTKTASNIRNININTKDHTAIIVLSAVATAVFAVIIGGLVVFYWKKLFASEEFMTTDVMVEERGTEAAEVIEEERSAEENVEITNY